MRIGLSSNFIEPALTQAKFDGIGTFTQNLYQQLLQQGHEIVPVIFPSFKNRRPFCQLPNSHIMTQPYSISAGLSALLGNEMPSGKKLSQKIDLYHCTDYLIPRLKGTPVLAMIHDAVKVQHPEWNSSRARKLKTWGLQKAIHWANHYIAPSHAVIPELVEHFGLDEKKISVVYNAIAESWLTPPTPEEIQTVLTKHQLHPGFLLFTGTFQPRKNLERILKAVESLPPSLLKEHPLVLVGQRGWIDEKVIQKIKTLSNKGLVHWLNYIDNQDLRCLYQSAKLFVFPSLHEGFGIPILEAFASKLPVLTSNISAMPEVSGDAAYLVDPYQTEEIRYGMITLLEKPELCQELVTKGQERVKAFTWTNSLDQILNVYQQLTEKI